MDARKQILTAAFAILVAPLAARAVSQADWSAPLSARAALQKAPAQNVTGDRTGVPSPPDSRFLLDEAHGLTSWAHIQPGTIHAAAPGDDACAPPSYALLSSIAAHGCRNAR